MTEIERKALALLNELSDYEVPDLDEAQYSTAIQALCRAIEQHEQFKREVSDAIIDCGAERYLDRFILPKPADPLVAVMDDFMSMDGGCLAECVEQFRVALAKSGLEVREIEK